VCPILLRHLTDPLLLTPAAGSADHEFVRKPALFNLPAQAGEGPHGARWTLVRFLVAPHRDRLFDALGAERVAFWIWRFERGLAPDLWQSALVAETRNARSPAAFREIVLQASRGNSHEKAGEADRGMRCSEQVWIQAA
jgi:hypothetical protein